MSMNNSSDAIGNGICDLPIQQLTKGCKTKEKATECITWTMLSRGGSSFRIRQKFLQMKIS